MLKAGEVGILNRPIIMKGDNVSLGMIHKDDIPLLWTWINDSTTRKFIRFPERVYFLEDEFEWYESLSKRKDTDRVFIIVDNKTDEGTGIVGLHGIDHLSRNAEIGYLISGDFRNRGIAREAVKLMMDYGRLFLNLRKIVAYVKDSNPASVRVLENNGFRECGKFRDHDYVPGSGYKDLIIFETFLS